MLLMNGVIKVLIDKFILFMDDILIYYRTWEEHDDHLTVTFHILRENQLYGKLSNCTFYQSKLLYLGHIVSE